MSIEHRPLRADAERNRWRLLEAARTVFAERGLDVTMDEIARAAGVGVGTAYRRFGSRDELIDALFEDRVAHVLALTDEALADPDPWRALTSFLERSLELQAADRGLKDLLLQDARGWERVASVRARLYPAVQRLVERARADLRPGVAYGDLVIATSMIGAAIDFTHEVDPQAWRRALAIVLEGLRGRVPLPGEPLTPPQVEAAQAWHRAR